MADGKVPVEILPSFGNLPHNEDLRGLVLSIRIGHIRALKRRHVVYYHRERIPVVHQLVLPDGQGVMGSRFTDRDLVRDLVSHG